jgi:hypothetical protein
VSVQLFPNGAGTIVETFNPVANTYNGGGTSTAERQVVSVADGGKATYSATYTGQSVGTAATTAVFGLTGSATKVVRLLQLIVNATIATAGEEYDFSLQKETALPTGGTKATTATVIPWDSSDGAGTALPLFYTATPTDGTLTGVVLVTKLSAFLATATTVQPPTTPYVFNFGNQPGAKGLVLRGATQAIIATLNAATPAHASSWSVTMIWTEE